MARAWTRSRSRADPEPSARGSCCGSRLARRGAPPRMTAGTDQCGAGGGVRGADQPGGPSGGWNPVRAPWRRAADPGSGWGGSRIDLGYRHCGRARPRDGLSRVADPHQSRRGAPLLPGDGWVRMKAGILPRPIAHAAMDAHGHPDPPLQARPRQRWTPRSREVLDKLRDRLEAPPGARRGRHAAERRGSVARAHVSRCRPEHQIMEHGVDLSHRRADRVRRPPLRSHRQVRGPKGIPSSLAPVA